MARGRSVALVLGASFVLACGVSEQAEQAGASEAPPERIVLLVVDTLRWDALGVNNGATPTPTPNIDALAARGQSLEAVSAYHMTSMSMATLWTGLTPSIEVEGTRFTLPWNSRNWCGLTRFAQEADARCIPDGVGTLGELMRDAGYETLGVASNTLMHGEAGFSRGFDVWREVGRSTGGKAQGLRRRARAERQAAQVLEATRAALAERKGDRFFLYVHWMDVHDYGRIGSERDILDWSGRYHDQVRKLDTGVGVLLRELEASGLLDGAVVVLTSDHGEWLGSEHPKKPELFHGGNPSYEPVLRVPLIIAPAHITDVADASRTIQAREVHGLLRELAGAPAAPPSESEPDELFVSEHEWFTLRSGQWKWTEKRGVGRRMLFDLAADPGETRNVALEAPEVAARMSERTAALADALATAPRKPRELADEERRRLQALGYLEEDE